MSDESTEVCDRIIETDLHVDIFSIFSWDTLSVASLNDSKANVKREVVTALRGVLHNVVKKAQTARSAFRKCNAVDVLQKYRGLTKYPVIFCFFIVFVSLEVVKCNLIPYI